jgi:hypothetical protein
MPPDHETLLRLATRPLEGNPELLVAARGDLESRLESDPESNNAVASAIDSFQRADRRGMLARHWRMLVYLTALALGVYGASQTLRLRAMAAQVTSITSIGPVVAASTPKRPSHLTSRERLLLYGDDQASNQTDRWKPLWDSDPSNPVFFAQYVHGEFSDRKSLTPELLADAARIDPGNGWYPAIQAGALLDGTVVREKQNPADQQALKAPTYTVKNPEKLAAAMELIHQAAAMERMNSRQEELIKWQIPLLGERTDWISQVPITAFAAGMTAPGSIAMRRLPDAFAGEAQRLAAEGKRDEFLRLVQSWDTINRHFLDGGWTMIDMLIAKVMIVSPAANFRDAALKLGLEKEAGRFEGIAAWSRDDRERRNRKNAPDPLGDLVERRGALLTALTLPMLTRQAENPPPLTEDDLLPSRLAEHALSQRILVTLSCLILALAAGLASIRFLGSSPLNRKLSARMTDLLQRRDWALVLLGGAVIPIVLYLVLVYLSPLSGRDWSLRLLGFIPLFAHIAAALVMVLTMTTALASHVLDRRLAAFGLTVGWPKTRWAMLLCAALSTIIIGAVAPAFHEFNLPPPARLILLSGGCLLIAIPLLWLIGGLVKPLIGFGGSTLRFATLHRVLVPAWIFGFVILAITSPLHHAIERHWMQQDRLMEITPDAPSLSRYEWETTQQLRRELRERL